MSLEGSGEEKVPPKQQQKAALEKYRTKLRRVFVVTEKKKGTYL